MKMGVFCCLYVQNGLTFTGQPASAPAAGMTFLRLSGSVYSCSTFEGIFIIEIVAVLIAIGAAVSSDGAIRTSSTIPAKQNQCTDRHGYFLIPVFAPLRMRPT
jgi:hypothetical protein